MSPDLAAGSGRAIFTVDLEEYFQVDALRDWVPKREWDSLPSRAGWVLDRLLERLESHDAGATFFVSGWLLRTRPELARRVVDAGHEAAVLVRPTPDGDDGARPAAFRQRADAMRDRLREVTRRPVLGFRVPRSAPPIPHSRAASILDALGYSYDSTAVGSPAAPDGEGVAASDGGTLLHVPPTTCSLGGERLFTAGGTAFRVLPEAVIHRLLRRAASPRCGGVFHMRSWEFDPEQPVLPAPPLARVRLYWGLDAVEERLDRLLDAFAFDSVAGALGLGPGGGRAASAAAERPEISRRGGAAAKRASSQEGRR